MKKIKFVVLSIFISSFTFAGNEDRTGSAGATQLLVNPFARSSAWASSGSSVVNGLEAQFLNISGLAYTDKTELIFARTNWLGGNSGVGLNVFGIAQRVSDNSAISISAMSLNYGEIEITNYDNPEGGIGTFSPSSNVFSVGYAKEFSESISGGLNMKIASEGNASAKATGLALDAGIRYTTGERDHMKFSIALKNVGPQMSYSGDGLSLETINPVTGQASTTQQRVQGFELPSLLTIGASYDFILAENHLLTTAGTFIANSFSRDQFAVGGEYTFKAEKAILKLRAGMVYEKGLFNEVDNKSAFNGPSGGVTFDFPMGKNGTLIGLDYTYRHSGVFGAIHTVGARINLN